MVCYVRLMAGFFKKIAEATGTGAINKATREERARLKDAERQEKAARQALAAETKNAQAAVDSAQREYSARVDAAATALKRLESPGVGDLLVHLGRVELYEHALAISSTPTPLAGVSADVQLTTSSALLQVRLPTGQVLLERFSTEWRNAGKAKYTTRVEGGYEIVESSQKTVRDFSEEQVLALGNAIKNQVIWHQRFIEEAPALIPQARAILEAEQANNRDLVAMQQVLAQVQASSPLLAALYSASQLVEQRRLEYFNARRQFEGLPPVDRLDAGVDLSDETVSELPSPDPAQAAQLPSSPELSSPATVAAAWHPDPFQRFQFRYWDGSAWTEHVSINGVTAVDPPTA